MKRLGKRENKNYSSVSFRFVPIQRVIENSKKITKKLKKYHYEFISSQNRLEIDEKERNKNYRSVPFRSVPTRCVIENSKQIGKNFKKIKKYHYEFISSQNRLKKDEKERNKNYRSIPLRSYPIRNIKFHKNSKKFNK